MHPLAVLDQHVHPSLIAARVQRILAGWRDRNADLYSSAASHALWEEFFLDKLRANKGSIDAVYIVDLARRRHPAPDMAVRRFYVEYDNANRLHDLPVVVRSFITEQLLLGRKKPGGYSKGEPQTASNFLRDYAIGCLMNVVSDRHHPRLPMYHGPLSVAALVGEAFGLKAQEARAIHKAHKMQLPMVAEFFLTHSR